MRAVLALAGAVAAAAAAIVLLLVAADVHRWQTTFADADIAFRTNQRSNHLWAVDARVPGDPVRRFLGLDDDLEYRNALRTFFLSRPRLDPLTQPNLDLARGEAQVQLTELARHDDDDARLSQEQNLLGALALATAPRQDREEQISSLESAVGYFTQAIRHDPRNEDAMYNLEAALQLLREIPKTFETKRGRHPLDDAEIAGLQDRGAGY